MLQKKKKQPCVPSHTKCEYPNRIFKTTINVDEICIFVHTKPIAAQNILKDVVAYTECVRYRKGNDDSARVFKRETSQCFYRVSSSDCLFMCTNQSGNCAGGIIYTSERERNWKKNLEIAKFVELSLFLYFLQFQLILSVSSACRIQNNR